MNKVFCNVCKKDITHKRKIEIVDTFAWMTSYHLCKKCHKKFKKWINGKE